MRVCMLLTYKYDITLQTNVFISNYTMVCQKVKGAACALLQLIHRKSDVLSTQLCFLLSDFKLLWRLKYSYENKHGPPVECITRPKLTLHQNVNFSTYEGLPILL